MANRPVFNAHLSRLKTAKLAHRTGAAAPHLIPAVLLAFGCGTGTAILLLAVFAFALERFSLPLGAVPAMAVAAAWVGAAVSGWMLATRFGRLRLVCGAACGMFYCLCLLLAGFVLARTVEYQGANLAVPIAFLLGGLAGGTLSALRTVHGTLPH